MHKPDARLLKAISSIKGNPDFEIFRDWIRESYMQLVTALINDGVTPDHTHRVIQGRAMTCGQIMEIINTAEEKLRKGTE